jgi:diguanylate cyclase (GGDEF)-like protein
MIVVNVVGYDQLIAGLGRKTGDTVLRKAAELLVPVTRPADLIARLREDEFAMWLSGADHFAAAERAEQLRIDGPGVLSMAVKNGVALASLSVGIATRHSGSHETPGSLMRRADYAMHEAKSIGPWTWRLSQEVVG